MLNNRPCVPLQLKQLADEVPARETKHDVAECDPPFRAVVTQERLSWHFG